MVQVLSSLPVTRDEAVPAYLTWLDDFPAQALVPLSRLQHSNLITTNPTNFYLHQSIYIIRCRPDKERESCFLSKCTPSPPSSQSQWKQMGTPHARRTLREIPSPLPRAKTERKQHKEEPRFFGGTQKLPAIALLHFCNWYIYTHTYTHEFSRNVFSHQRQNVVSVQHDFALICAVMFRKFLNSATPTPHFTDTVGPLLTSHFLIMIPIIIRGTYHCCFLWAFSPLCTLQRGRLALDD